MDNATSWGQHGLRRENAYVSDDVACLGRNTVRPSPKNIDASLVKGWVEGAIPILPGRGWRPASLAESLM